MPAKVEIHAFNGITTPPLLTINGLTWTNITEGRLRFKREDNNNIDLSKPVPIPSTGVAYSWRKHTRLFVKERPVLHINNIRWFAEPAPKDWRDQVTLFAAPALGYTSPVASDEYTQVAGTTDANYHSAANPITISVDINSALFLPNGAIHGDNSYGDQGFIVQQIGVQSTCTSEVKSGRICSYRFDEV